MSDRPRGGRLGRGVVRASCLLALLLLGCGRVAEAPVATRPAYEALSPYVSLPPWLEERLVVYHGFERADGEAEVRADAVEWRGKPKRVAEGFRGRGAVTGKGGVLQLRSADFSPHRPLSVLFWWAMLEEPKPENCFGLFHLSGGRGMVSHFSRGKGGWCALQRPAAILQVYNIPGIRNVNGIYDRDLLAHVDLRAGVWHHTALVFRGASLVEVYTDGAKAWETRLRGRPFREGDGLCELVVGTRGRPGVAVDEVIVLRRALTGEVIGRYVRALRQMREIDYPAPRSSRCSSVGTLLAAAPAARGASGPASRQAVLPRSERWSVGVLRPDAGASGRAWEGCWSVGVLRPDAGASGRAGTGSSCGMDTGSGLE